MRPHHGLALILGTVGSDIEILPISRRIGAERYVSSLGRKRNREEGDEPDPDPRGVGEHGQGSPDQSTAEPTSGFLELSHPFAQDVRAVPHLANTDRPANGTGLRGERPGEARERGRMSEFLQGGELPCS
jgi:hypothetical protein